MPPASLSITDVAGVASIGRGVAQEQSGDWRTTIWSPIAVRSRSRNSDPPSARAGGRLLRAWGVMARPRRSSTDESGTRRRRAEIRSHPV